jgi:uncharacterized protein YndB with AHSA1/START domain
MSKVGRQSAVVTLPSDTEILITREFAAPARHIWRAWTTPELIRQWWHANRGVVTECTVDLRVGGRWRWVMLAHGNFEVAFSGEYRELDAPRRMVSTEVFEAVGGDGSLNTLTLTEHARGTTLQILVQHAEQAHRDAHVNSGMEGGMQDALDLLDDVVGALQ